MYLNPLNSLLAAFTSVFPNDMVTWELIIWAVEYLRIGRSGELLIR